MWSAPGFECAPRNMRCIFNFTIYGHNDQDSHIYGSEIGTFFFPYTYWSYNAANQQCCWNRWMEANSDPHSYYDYLYGFESAYDLDNNPNTVTF